MVNRLFMAPMQDYLELDESCSMNRPGTTSGNWQWRLLPGEASEPLAERIAELSSLYNR